MWDIDSLKEYLTKLRSTDRKYIDQRFEDQQRSVAQALASAKEAVIKAESASEKRFDSVNEFRAALDDNQRMLMPRREAEMRMDAIDARVDMLVAASQRVTGARVGAKEAWAYVVAVIGMVFGLISLLS